MAATELQRAYRVFHLVDTASLEIAEAAYKALMKTVHPDKGGTNEQAREAYVERITALTAAAPRSVWASNRTSSWAWRFPSSCSSWARRDAWSWQSLALGAARQPQHEQPVMPGAIGLA